LSSGVTGILPVSNGGTGVNTLSGLVKGNGGSAMTVAINGTLSSSGKIGYTQTSNTVTQQTTKSTAVTLDKLSGTITMNNAALPAATTVSFTFTNSNIDAAASNMVLLSIVGGTTTPAEYSLAAIPGTGSAVIHVRNLNAATAKSDALQIRFAVIKTT
jgi:hypothetical protein